MTAVLRASLVDYVNAWPLTWGFLRGAVEGVEALTDIPSACADRLARGEVEAGLVPSIEAARIPGIRIVRGVGIASRERVRSVILVEPRSPSRPPRRWPSTSRPARPPRWRESCSATSSA